MRPQQNLEVWLRGPLPGIPPLLQPVAHAILQAREEVGALMVDFPEHKLWEKPAGAASVGFHLQHLSGVLDRLFTYAKGELLSDEQQKDLLQEKESYIPNLTVADLLSRFKQQVDLAIDQLKATSESELTARRGVGRAQVPSTVIGLYTHSAEHTMRHLGQLLVTVKVLKAS